MNPATQHMLADVLHAMQRADEIEGLDPVEYVRFMHAIAKEATDRAVRAAKNTGIVRAAASMTMRAPAGSKVERLAYCILDGQYRGSVFYASDAPPQNFDVEVTVQFHPDSQHARRAAWPFGDLYGEP